MDEVLQECLFLLILPSSFLGVQVFTENGSLAGHVVLIGRVED